MPFCVTVSYVWQYLYVGRMFFISWLIERDLYGLHVALDTIIYINPSSISIDPIMKNLHDFFVMGSSPNITTTITNSDRSELVEWLAGWVERHHSVGIFCVRSSFSSRNVMQSKELWSATFCICELTHHCIKIHSTEQLNYHFNWMCAITSALWTLYNPMIFSTYTIFFSLSLFLSNESVSLVLLVIPTHCFTWRWLGQN